MNGPQNARSSEKEKKDMNVKYDGICYIQF